MNAAAQPYLIDTNEMLRDAEQQVFGLKAENAELRTALREAAESMRNMSHLSAKYRTMLMAREPK